MKKNILVVTVHPAVDYLFWPDRNAYHISDGGKGVNVGRVLTLLNQKSQYLHLKQGAFRTNITIHRKAADPRRFLGLGTPPTARQKAQFKTRFRALVKKAEIVLLCGSTPQKSQGLYPWMLRTAQAQKTPVWVDASQPALGLSIQERPQLVKPNLKELEEWSRISLKTQKAQIAAVQRILRRGIDAVALTLGQEGAMLCKKDEIWYARAPKVKSVSELGCGDAFFASLCFSYLKKRSAAKMLSHALALAAASACTPIPGQFQKSYYLSLEKKIKIQQLL